MNTFCLRDRRIQENCLKLKKIGPRGHASLAPIQRSATRLLKCTSGATPADLLAATFAAEAVIQFLLIDKAVLPNHCSLYVFFAASRELDLPKDVASRLSTRESMYSKVAPPGSPEHLNRKEMTILPPGQRVRASFQDISNDSYKLITIYVSGWCCFSLTRYCFSYFLSVVIFVKGHKKISRPNLNSWISCSEI